MNSGTIHLDVFPSHQEAKRFLDDILPRLIACGLSINPHQDDPCLEETNDGYANVSRLAVYDREDRVFSLVNRTLTYVDLTDLAEALEHKQVELQLNALQARMAAVGWRIRFDEKQSAEGGTGFWKFTLIRSDGEAQDYAPTYANLNQLRQELIRTEATRWVQLHWLELEAAGCEITLGTDVIKMRWKGDEKIYGYTLEEAKDLTNKVLSPFNTDFIV